MSAVPSYLFYLTCFSKGIEGGVGWGGCHGGGGRRGGRSGQFQLTTALDLGEPGSVPEKISAI